MAVDGEVPAGDLTHPETKPNEDTSEVKTEVGSEHPSIPHENGDGDDNEGKDEGADKDDDMNINEEEEEAEGAGDLDLNVLNEEFDPLLDQTQLKPLLERRDRSLKELLQAMDEYSPIIPDAVTDYYLARSGFRTSDQRIKRLLALATQKFISDVATDAYQFARIRSQSGGGGAPPGGGGGSGIGGPAGAGRRPGYGSNKIVLTMEALSTVLSEYGINAKRPDFYR